MHRACSAIEQPSRTSAVIRRTAVYAGVSVVTAGAAAVFAASPAEAAETDDIDLDEATSAEIEDHVEELESERDDTADRLAVLERRLVSAQAVVDAAETEYGSTDAQLDQVTLVVDAAEENLGAKMSSLVGFAREQSESFDRAQAASAEAEALGTEIDAAEADIAELDERIGEAEDAAQEAAEEEEAAAAAAAEAEAEAETDSSGSSGSGGSATANYSSDAATAAVEFAYDQLGESYVFGAAGPDTWDCSGLVQGAYAVSGVSVTHSTSAIWSETAEIGRDDLRPGDLVFYAGIGHVAIYIGEGQVIHAPHTGDVVKISDIDMMSIDGYRRV
ncbi:C40 family peptidase [Glycomyces arizonensis]|uniref:C40 family peptidase n=1 Tax=Glycomyces arizonensis TaxID=256035 RepID=UPI000411EA0D|nr:C40 family peptidase [Glycomyces arizonensis]